MIYIAIDDDIAIDIDDDSERERKRDRNRDRANLDKSLFVELTKAKLPSIYF